MTEPSNRIRRVLIANRGEIARRVIRTCRDMGIQSVAVYSIPDTIAPHTREADVAVPIGGSSATESYLDVDKIVRAALRTHADAVHPGYGFIAENPDAAQAVIDAGLIWIGPTPAVIRAMALKVEAKQRMAEVGVPVLTGATITGDDAHLWHQLAEGVGYPLLVKASAGGGGKGMHTVTDASHLADSIRTARREAGSSFGDPTVFLERLLIEPRHVEVQVLGDSHGSILHLYERDCSIQRRHQKVIEEAPAPSLSPRLRSALHEAALTAARAIGYTNAGTVEFLVANDELFFLEMNTRLQVEHPVTEMVTGLDLVRLQIEVASGAPLKLSQQELRVNGHAIEARIYAEDPANGFLPSTGVVHRFDLDRGSAGIRVDAGIETGSVVSPFYDPMLAKVIGHATTRDEAARRLAASLRSAKVHGLTTNLESLTAILETESFLTAAVHTAFFDHHPQVLAPRTPAWTRRLHALAAVFVLRHRRACSATPQLAPPGWRNVPSTPTEHVFTLGGVTDTADSDVRVLVGPVSRGEVSVIVDGVEIDYAIVSVSDYDIELELDGLRYSCTVDSHGARHWINGGGWQLELVERDLLAAPQASAALSGPTAPLPGTVILVAVEEGQSVSPGDLLVVLEAMKMEHRIVADRTGVVTRIRVAAGTRVDAHDLLVELGDATAPHESVQSGPLAASL